MKLFFEAVQYQANLLEKFFGKKHSIAISKGGRDDVFRTVNGVGYCLDAKDSEHVFVLPKNFVIEGKAFGCIPIPKYHPLEDSAELKRSMKANGWSEELLSILPVYLYRAIDRYRKLVQENCTTEEDESIELYTSKRGDSEPTLLDITLSLQDFYRENQSLFVMIYKQAHSGFNKVQWSKTVRKSLPIVEEENMIYPYIINKKKEINYDEELLVLFFNTLRYINKNYHFSFTIDQPYNLLSDSEFERKLDSGIVWKRLKAIKNFYFNELLVKLWHLLFLFVSKVAAVKSSRTNGDYLFARHFETAFEKMVDSILSDTDAPDILVNQADGKEVDHLFKGKSIISDTLDIYYIGDSKYYLTGRRPQYESLFKQYTYAKNIIQTEIDWYNTGKHPYLKYRDDLTEGYNLIPNFFISGKVEPSWGFNEDHLTVVPDAFQTSYHFPNRIFDRDTLFLMQYDVNILFIIYAFVHRSQRLRFEFKTKAKNSFKREFINSIEARYDFYILRAKNREQTSDLVLKHFRRINGKVFAPYKNEGDRGGLILLGLSREALMDNLEVILALQDDFIIKEYHLGSEPYIYYLGLLNGIETSRSLVLRDGLKITFENHKRESVIVTSFPSKEELDKAVENRKIPIPLADLVNRCSGRGCQPIFTSAYIFIYRSDKPKEDVLGYVLTGKITYNRDLNVLYYEIDPMRIGGSLEISQLITKHTRGTNAGSFFLSFEDASDDFYSND